MTRTPLIIQSGQTKQLPDSESLRTNQPCCRLSRSTAQDIPSNAYTVVQFSNSVFEMGGDWWAASPNPSRIVIPEAGIYMIGGAARIGNLYGATSAFQFWVNGTGLFEHHLLYSAPSQTLRGDTLLQFNAGDYWEFKVYQSSGGTKQLEAVAGLTATAWAFRVR